jgi:hypothetical protein
MAGWTPDYEKAMESVASYKEFCEKDPRRSNSLQPIHGQPGDRVHNFSQLPWLPKS